MNIKYRKRYKSIDITNINTATNYFYIKIYIIANTFLVFLLLIKINSLENKISNVQEPKFENKEKYIREISNIDQDLIGLTYPEIYYDALKKELNHGTFFITFTKFLNQLQQKLIYLEKEINITKISSFYSIRKRFLDMNHIHYNDEKIVTLENIVSWATIHASNQLKGIASDKYLGCKYAQIKLGKNICQQRIRSYDNVEEIDFEELIKKGNVILKISSGCHDSVFIRSNTNKDNAKKLIKHYFKRDYGLIYPQFFHLYSKKRIIEEKIFEPITDLYEFKFFVVNNNIKFFLVNFQVGKTLHKNFYDPNYNLLEIGTIGLKSFDLNKKFGEEILNKLKYYVTKLSEDFKNFIRVDLYIFQENIYLSELTFDSNDGFPFYENKGIILDAAKNFEKYE